MVSSWVSYFTHNTTITLVHKTRRIGLCWYAEQGELIWSAAVWPDAMSYHTEHTYLGQFASWTWRVTDSAKNQ